MQWKEVLDTWHDNAGLWSSVSEARPGDFLYSDDDNLPRHFRFDGVPDNNPRYDSLAGIYEVEKLPTLTEPVKRISGAQAQLNPNANYLGLERLTNDQWTYRVWSTHKRSWSRDFANTPLVLRPEPQQTISPVGKVFVAAGLCMAAAGTLELGELGLEAAPSGLVVTGLAWGVSADLILNLWNVVNMD